MGSATFYESVADLAEDLPANRLFLPAIVQEALADCLEEYFSTAGGIFLDIPVQQGGEYGTEAENFVSVTAAQALPPSGNQDRLCRQVDVSVSFHTARDLSYAHACALFHCILNGLQPANLETVLQEALTAVDATITLASLRDAGEVQEVGDAGRILTKNLAVTIGISV